jgi:hypothetical protein
MTLMLYKQHRTSRDGKSEELSESFVVTTSNRICYEVVIFLRKTTFAADTCAQLQRHVEYVRATHMTFEIISIIAVF